MTYLLTFACYGSYLPGEEGSIDRYRNLPGSRLTPPNPALLRPTQMAMRQVPYEMHAAIRYVLDKQGDPMAVWQAPPRSAP